MSALAQEPQPLQQRAAEATRHAATLLGSPELGTADLEDVIARLGERIAQLGIDSELVREQLGCRPAG